jgi:hypothetical protein
VCRFFFGGGGRRLDFFNDNSEQSRAWESRSFLKTYFFNILFTPYIIPAWQPFEVSRALIVAIVATALRLLRYTLIFVAPSPTIVSWMN